MDLNYTRSSWNLIKTGIHEVSRCSMCKNQEESLDHLFLHCPFAFEVWGSLLSRFGQSWVILVSMPSLVEGWQQAFKGDLSQRGKAMQECIPIWFVGWFGTKGIHRFFRRWDLPQRWWLRECFPSSFCGSRTCLFLLVVNYLIWYSVETSWLSTKSRWFLYFGSYVLILFSLSIKKQIVVSLDLKFSFS